MQNFLAVSLIDQHWPGFCWLSSSRSSKNMYVSPPFTPISNFKATFPRPILNPSQLIWEVEWLPRRYPRAECPLFHSSGSAMLPCWQTDTLPPLWWEAPCQLAPEGALRFSPRPDLSSQHLAESYYIFFLEEDSLNPIIIWGLFRVSVFQC